MSERLARGVERQMQEAERRGEFQNLPGAGKPLPGIGSPQTEDWWLRQKATRENIGAEALPPALRLRKEVDQLPALLDALDEEAEVRRALEALNERIRKALIGPVDGPPLNFGLIDAEEALAAWRARRA
ncbi:DnaJ family domain-containing protein [Glycomyces tarimensis]